MAKELYTVDWGKPSGTIKLGEYDVPLPSQPKKEDMENHGLPENKQKFYKTIIPDSVLKRKSIAEESEEEDFIKGEYHKIHNGTWVLIKGIPVYITGAYYFFLNYWTTNQGKKPDFRYIQSLLFLIWEMVINDKNSYGLFLVKPRRVGGTEITIQWLYVDVLRYRNMVCGMQSKNEDSVFKNYRRILNAHKNMIWFFKPINQGSSGNKDGLFLRYPEEQQTAKKLKEVAENGDKESNYEDPEINSDLTYQPSVATAYDGERLDRYILNEFGKVEKMSVLDCWDKVKPCLHLDNGETITGKGIMESTIEEMNDDQISELVDFWNDSDTSNLDGNGRTTSGLYRLFISAADAAKEDEWGFPMTAETLVFLEKQFAALKAAGKTKELARLKRKVPLVIEDALTPSGDQCAFNKDNLIEALSNLDFPMKGHEKPTTRGNLVWENGNFNGRVLFEQNPDGLFEFSMLAGPNSYPDNAVSWYGPDRIPGNVNKIRIGCDPYSHKETVDNRKSKGGVVGMIMYDDLKDGAKVGDDGKPFDLALEWETHQPIFTYYYRQPDPQDFFEDVLKAAVYCGTTVLFENNKQSIIRHFENRGYSKFVMLRPEGTMSEAQRTKVQTEGIPAVEYTIQQYYDCLDSFIARNACSIKHRKLIEDLLAMNRQNHGKHDLGVAFGWALIALTKKYAEVKPKEEKPEPWFETYEV